MCTGGAYSAPQDPLLVGKGSSPSPRTPAPLSAFRLEFRHFGPQDPPLPQKTWVAKGSTSPKRLKNTGLHTYRLCSLSCYHLKLPGCYGKLVRFLGNVKLKRSLIQLLTSCQRTLFRSSALTLPQVKVSCILIIFTQMFVV